MRNLGKVNLCNDALLSKVNGTSLTATFLLAQASQDRLKAATTLRVADTTPFKKEYSSACKKEGRYTRTILNLSNL